MIETGSRTGEVLRGRYRIVARIGRGGMGEVFEADDLRLGRRVAVKTLIDHDARDLERFRREAAAAAQLSHPHIAQVFDYDLGDASSVPIIVMERLHGKNLGELLREEGRLAVPRALEIAAQVASALAAAHAAQIVHRDIKPENIFLVRTATAELVKVLDFGIAKIEGARALTGTDQIVGTVQFMSPEQAMADVEIGPATDVFSLGVVLYEMLTGVSPHLGTTVRSILAGLQRGELVPLSERDAELPPAVVDVVTRALAIDRAKRYPDGSALSAALEALRAGAAAPPIAPFSVEDETVAGKGARPPSGVLEETVEQRPGRDPTPQQATKRDDTAGAHPRRNRWGIAASLGGVTVVLIGMGVWWPSRTGDRVDTPGDATVVVQEPAGDAAPPPRVGGVVVGSSAVSFDRTLGDAQWRELQIDWTFVASKVEHCYRDATIDGGYQTDAVRLQLAATGVIEHVVVTRSRDGVSFATPAPIAACLEASIRPLFARWRELKVGGTASIEVRTSTQNGHPLRRS